MNRIRNFLVAAGVFVLVIVIYLTLSVVTKKPQKAYDFSAGTQHGQVVSLSDNYGKRGSVVIFIDPEIEGATKLLSQIIKLHGDADIIALSVSELPENEQKEKLKAASADILELEKLCFESSEAIEKYNIGATPVTYFIDKDGYVVDVFVGAIRDSSIEKCIEKIN